jgi:hypothetical protein
MSDVQTTPENLNLHYQDAESRCGTADMVVAEHETVLSKIRVVLVGDGTDAAKLETISALAYSVSSAPDGSDSMQ